MRQKFGREEVMKGAKKLEKHFLSERNASEIALTFFLNSHLFSYGINSILILERYWAENGVNSQYLNQLITVWSLYQCIETRMNQLKQSNAFDLFEFLC